MCLLYQHAHSQMHRITQLSWCCLDFLTTNNLIQIHTNVFSLILGRHIWGVHRSGRPCIITPPPHPPHPPPPPPKKKKKTKKKRKKKTEDNKDPSASNYTYYCHLSHVYAWIHYVYKYMASKSGRLQHNLVRLRFRCARAYVLWKSEYTIYE